jgi:thiamine-monophosphate kinase
MGAESPGDKGERELIRRIRQIGMGESPMPADDMAALPGMPTVLWSTDMLMDGVDFRSGEHDWYDIGRKAMGVNLSDCAAMATRPLAALCAVSLSETMSMDDALALHRGVSEMGLEYGCPLIGGDTNSWDRPTVICVTVTSRVPAGRHAVTRCGARPGDWVCVTGRLGGSILGRHLRVWPRVNEALEIAARVCPTAMIDVSDGLATDLHHICAESHCGAIIEHDLLDAVVHPDALRLSRQTGRPAIDHVLFDGEDFELIVAVPPDTSPVALESVDLARIGTVTASPGVRLRGSDGNLATVRSNGWEHFQ